MSESAQSPVIPLVLRASLSPDEAAAILLPALRHPQVRAELLAIQVEAGLEVARRLAARAAGLTDAEMAERLGVHVRTLRRRAAQDPTLAALASCPGPRAARWPAQAVADWWAAHAR